MHHAVARLAEVCDEIVVVIASGAAEPPLPPGVPVRFARDATEAQGPLAGAYAGLLAVTTGLALVAGGDMPELQTTVLFEMLELAVRASADAVALQEGDRARPLPCVVRAERAVDVAHTLLHSGRRSLRHLLDALQVAVVDESTWHALDPEGRTLFDVDEPADLTG